MIRVIKAGLKLRYLTPKETITYSWITKHKRLITLCITSWAYSIVLTTSTFSVQCGA